DARLDWVDETRRFPEVHAPDVDVAVRHDFIRLTPVAGQGNGATCPLPSGDGRGARRPGLGLPGGAGERLERRLYLALQGADLAELGAWSDDSLGELQGRAAGRAWIDLRRSRVTGWTGELVAQGFNHAGAAAVPSIAAESLRVSFQGDDTVRHASGTVSVRDGAVNLSRFFEQGDIPVHALDLDGNVQWFDDGSLQLDIKQLALDAGEPGARARATAQGSWRSGEGL